MMGKVLSISSNNISEGKRTNNTRYHGVELGQVSCGKQPFRCRI